MKQNEKLLLHVKFSCYGQHFDNKYSPTGINGKLILNTKLACKLYKDNVTVLVDIRNLFDKKRKFASMDEIGSLYLPGLTMKF